VRFQLRERMGLVIDEHCAGRAIRVDDETKRVALDFR
jgi:hypothetical protein